MGLFKGVFWVDGRTGLPVHESGQFIKSPSVFIKRISFTRDSRDARVLSFRSTFTAPLESRIVGRVELDIEFADASVLNSTEGAPNDE